MKKRSREAANIDKDGERLITKEWVRELSISVN